MSKEWSPGSCNKDGPGSAGLNRAAPCPGASSSVLHGTASAEEAGLSALLPDILIPQLRLAGDELAHHVFARGVRQHIHLHAA